MRPCLPATLRRLPLRLAALVLAWLPAPVAVAQSHAAPVKGATFSADEQTVLTAAQNELKIWRADTGGVLCRASVPFSQLMNAVPIPGGFAVQVADGQSRQETNIRHLRLMTDGCRLEPSATPTPASPLLARPVTAADGYACRPGRRGIDYVRLRAGQSDERLATSGGRRPTIGCGGPLALSPDGRYLVDVGVGRVIDIARRRIARESAEALWSPRVLFSPTQPRVALVDTYNRSTIRIYDLDRGRQIGRDFVVESPVDLGPSLTTYAFRDLRLTGGGWRLITLVRDGATLSLDDYNAAAGARALEDSRRAQEQARLDAMRRESQARERRQQASRDAARASGEAFERALEAHTGRRIVAQLGLYGYETNTNPYRWAYMFDRITLQAGDVLAVTSDGGSVSYPVINDGLVRQSGYTGEIVPIGGREVRLVRVERAVTNAEFTAESGRGSARFYILRR